MSYTMTLDMPKEEIELAKAQAAEENTDLSKLFVAFLRDRAMKSLEMEKATRQRDAILAAAGGWQDDPTEKESDKANKFWALCRELPPSGLPKGYVFSRDEVSERESRCLS